MTSFRNVSTPEELEKLIGRPCRLRGNSPQKIVKVSDIVGPELQAVHVPIAARAEELAPKEQYGLNRLESAYYDHLQTLVRCGAIRAFWTHGIALQIGHDCRYVTDFMVQTLAGVIEIHETKGFMREDAQVKLKAVARTYPFPVYVIRGKKEKGRYILDAPERVHP